MINANQQTLIVGNLIDALLGQLPRHTGLQRFDITNNLISLRNFDGAVIPPTSGQQLIIRPRRDYCCGNLDARLEFSTNNMPALVEHQVPTTFYISFAEFVPAIVAGIVPVNMIQQGDFRRFITLAILGITGQNIPNI